LKGESTPSVFEALKLRDPFAQDIEFRRLIQGDEDVDLVKVSVEIARDAEFDFEEAEVYATIETLGDRVRERCAPGAGFRSVLGQLNWVLFVEEQFQGNVEDYYDPRNSYIQEVIRRKLGLPILLSILYKAISDRVGVPLDCVNLPMHFALRVSGREEPLFVDPFHQGRLIDVLECERFLGRMAGREVRLSPEECEGCQASVTIARMLRNLKFIYLGRKDYGSALPVVRRLAALHRDDLIEQRDWGMVSFHSDHPGEALAPLQRYIDGRPHEPDIPAVRTLLSTARREVARRN
jgi:regulator of sirC expression with transglutaminase-like and TPR domain